MNIRLESPLKPKPGDCRVFCSHGSVPCPPAGQGNGGYRNGSAAE